jgi:hypothetical protein
MDTSALLSVAQESIFAIIVFVLFLVLALAKGRQALINVIMGLYFALLITLKFPYFDTFTSGVESAKGKSIVMIVVFSIFAILATILFGRLMPREWQEKVFESFGKKIAFALAGTVLVMAYSYHALPITEIIDPGSPMQYLFGSEHYFFWWLLLPLVVLFFL